MNYTETWSSLLDVLSKHEKRPINKDGRYVFTCYAMDNGCGCEYKVIGDNKILITMIYKYERDLSSSQWYSIEEILAVFCKNSTIVENNVPMSFYEQCNSDYTGEVSDF